MIRFLGVDIETGPGALIPRPETELCGRTAIAKLAAVGGTRFVDVCCGTGNLACAIAAAAPHARGFALDLTDGAVALARRNVARLGLGERVEVRQGDLLAPLGAQSGFELVVCNPPYISTSKLATRDDLASEPREAFDGGPYGLSIHQRVAREALPHLKGGGWLVFELGVGQERQLELVVQRARGYDRFELVNDDSGAPRVAAARKKEQQPG